MLLRTEIRRLIRNRKLGCILYQCFKDDIVGFHIHVLMYTLPKLALALSPPEGSNTLLWILFREGGGVAFPVSSLDDYGCGVLCRCVRQSVMAMAKGSSLLGDLH